MSESEKRKAISVYLTPRASMILHDYNEGSGYGSISRTVEEIILAFDFTYKSITQTGKMLASQPADKSNISRQEALTFFLSLVSSIQNIGNALSRLQSASSLD